MKHITWVLALLLAIVTGTCALAAEATPDAFATETPADNTTLDTLSQWYGDASQTVEGWVQQSGELEVRGQAARAVVPDTVTMRIGASVENADEGIAHEEANRVIGEVIDALKALGVTAQQMQTSGYDITRRETGRSSLLSSAEMVYVATVTLRVTVQDFELINEILDTAVEKGANEIGSVAFSCSEEGEVYRLALEDAIAAAQVKAEAMARAAGVELRALLRLTEGSGYSPVLNAYAPKTNESGKVAGTQIMAGEIEISASVTMVYAVK